MQILRGDDRSIASTWQSLENHVGEGRLPISWSWTSRWIERFGDTVSHRFAVVERAGEPIAAVLLSFARRGPVRALHLGTAGEPHPKVFVEYNDLLCAPGDRTAVAAALLHTVRNLPGWDELRLDGFRAEAVRAVQAVLPVDASTDRSWTMRLGPRPVLDTLSGSTRRLVRQAREALQPDEPEQALDRGTAASMMAELVELHQARWTGAGRTGVFSSARVSGFLHDLVDDWLPAGRIQLHRLTGAEGTLGCVLGFVENGRFLYYQSGFAHFTDSRKRPGLLCHAMFAEQARLRGLAEYELLAGDAQYKRQLSAGEFNPLVWGRFERPTFYGSSLSTARALRSRFSAWRANRAD